MMTTSYRLIHQLSRQTALLYLHKVSD